MARLALGVAGGIIGGPIGMSIGFALGSLLFPEKKHVEGPRIGELRLQGASYGAGIPDVYGAARVAGQVIWASKIREVASTSGGGKGGPSVSTTTYSYFASFAVLLCRGPVRGYRRIWADSELLVGSALDATTGPQAAISAALNHSPVTVEGLEFYTGTETQTPDATIEADVGAGNAPAFRGWSYIVFTDLALARFGNRRPNITVEVLTSASATPQITEVLRFTTATPVDAGESAAMIGAAGGRVMWFGPGNSWAGSLASANVTTVPNGRSDDDTSPAESSSTPHEFADTGPLNDPTSEKVWRYPDFYAELYKFRGDADSFEQIALKRARTGTGGSDPFSPELIFFDRNSGARYTFNTGLTGTWQTWGRYVYRNGTMLAWNINHNNPGEMWLAKFNPFVGFFDPVTIIKPKLEASTNAIQRYVISSAGDYVYAYALNAANTEVWLHRLASPFSGAWEDKWAVIPRGNLHSDLLATTSPEGIWVGDDISQEYVLLSYQGREIRRWQGVSASGHTKDQVFVNGRLIIHTHDSQIFYYVPDDVGGALDAGVLLRDVVADICTRVGAPHDVSLLTGSVLGHWRAEPMAARAAIESLQKSHYFDAVESGDVIKFVPRGQASAATIPVDALLAEEPLKLTRAADLELPRRVTVRYVSALADYQDGAQQSQRIITRAEGEVTADLPTVLTDEGAAQAAEVLLFDAWQSRERVQFGLSSDHARLEPTDVVTIQATNADYQVRVVDDDFEMPGRVSLRGVVEDSSVYSSEAPAQPLAITPATLPFTGITELEILDIPLLDDAHNERAVYALAYPPVGVTGWQGAEIHRSPDGVSFDAVATITKAGTFGTLRQALPKAASTTIPDTLNTIDVQLRTAGSFASVTDAEFLANKNAVLVGSEIITFRDATLTAPGRYTLSHLARGRLGTERWTNHRAGERVALLDDALVQVPIPVSSLRTSVSYRAATFGTLPASAPSEAHNYNGFALRPYSPAGLTATNAGGGNYALAWTRRTRKGGAWLDGTGVPLGEEFELYRVTVYSGAAILSTADVSTPAATVAASSGNRITVQQVSSVYGAGELAEVTIP